MSSSRASALRAMSLLDLTDLAEDANEAGLRSLCERATGGPVPVAAICIWPRLVAKAREILGDGPVSIATVVNFPQGNATTATVVREVEAALTQGADEIDLVLPWRNLLLGQTDSARELVEMTKARCVEKRLKIILETGEYPDLASVKLASELAIAAGADFIKTSTGKTGHAATPEAVRVMLEVIRATPRLVGLKPSGGIRTLADAETYLGLADEIMGPSWATPQTFRFGASGLYQALLDEIVGQAAAASGESY
jgi:deoxyribose-phosphate aldolase